MVCENMRQLCHLYLDDRLEGQQKQELEDHLIACPECREYLEQMSRLRELVHKTRERTCPEVDWNAVEKQAAAARKQRRTRRYRKVAYGATAAAAAVILCLFLASPLLQQYVMSPMVNDATTAQSADMAAPEEYALESQGESAAQEAEIPSSSPVTEGGATQESTPEEDGDSLSENGKAAENPARVIFEAAQTYVESSSTLISGELTLEDIEAYLPSEFAGQAVIHVENSMVTGVEYTNAQGSEWTYLPE